MTREGELLDLGGKKLLATHAEAGAYVDDANPWDGEGNEPGELISVYLAVLWQVAETMR